MMNEAWRLFAALLCLQEGASEQEIRDKFLSLCKEDGDPMPALLVIAQQLKTRLDVASDNESLVLGIQMGDFGFDDKSTLFGATTFSEVALRKSISMKINQDRFSDKGVMH